MKGNDMTTQDIDPRQEWRTPDDLWRAVNSEFCFQLDAAASRENFRCPHFLSLERGQDGLVDDWVIPEYKFLYRIWCNPGFAQPFPWAQKAHAEAQKSASAVCVVMGIADPSTQLGLWAYENATEIRYLNPRVQFVPAPGVEATSNSKPSCLMIFRRKVVKIPAYCWTWKWK